MNTIVPNIIVNHCYQLFTLLIIIIDFNAIQSADCDVSIQIKLFYLILF